MSSLPSDAVSCKEEGNRLFAQGRYLPAIASYEAALTSEGLSEGSLLIFLQCRSNLAEAALRAGRDASKSVLSSASSHCQIALEKAAKAWGKTPKNSVLLQKLRLRRAKLALEVFFFSEPAELGVATLMASEGLRESCCAISEDNPFRQVLSKAKKIASESTELRLPLIAFRGELEEFGFDFSWIYDEPYWLSDEEVTKVVASSPLPPPLNLIILLHGMGGCGAKFGGLPKSWRLRRTAFLLLNGPEKVPLKDLGLASEDGFAWLPVEGYSSQKKTFADVANRFVKAVLGTLVQCCGWRENQIFLVGHGQGGEVAAAVGQTRTSSLGGVVAVGCDNTSSSSSSSSVVFLDGPGFLDGKDAEKMKIFYTFLADRI